MSLELNPVFEGSGLQLGPVFDVAGVPTIGTVTAGDTTLTIPYTGAVTHYRVYALGSGAPAWISAPPSPIVFTGTSNTEYQVEVSGDGSTVADSEQAGTNNPGTGGGEFTLPSEFLAGATLPGVVAGGSLGSGGAFAAGALLGSVRAGGVLSGASVVASFGSGAQLGSVIADGVLSGASVVASFGSGAQLGSVIAGGTLQGAIVSAFGEGALLSAVRAGGAMFGSFGPITKPPIDRIVLSKRGRIGPLTPR